MAIEKTFVMLKPDCIRRKLMGEVISRIENKGYRIVNAEMQKLTSSFLYEFYAHIMDKPFFLQVFQYMLAGPVLGMIVEGENAVQGMRRLIGPTLLEEAMPGSVRGDFAESSANNIIHSSHSIESAEKECNVFFRKNTRFEPEKITEE